MSAEQHGEPLSSATGKPLSARGRATRSKLLAAAEQVFVELGYHDASIVRITERAGIGLGTFYLYFDSKQSIFEALVLDLNSRVRQAMSQAMANARTRLEAERLGFEGFFAFTAEHPALYRVVREAELVSPEAMREHYARIVEGYREGLRQAQSAGEIDVELDPEVTAWALMGVGELIGMRYVLWERDVAGRTPQRIDPAVLDAAMRFIDGALRGGRGSTPGRPHRTEEGS